MNEDNRKRVYDVLKEQTGYLDSYEDFNKAFDASEDNRRRVYDVLKNQTGYLDSYEDFTKGMSAPATSVAQQVIDEYDRSNRSLRTTPPVVLDNPAGNSQLSAQSPEETEKTLFANYVREQLGNIDNELNKPREALPMPAGSAFIPSTAVAAAQRYGNVQTREQQDRYTSLRAARNFLDDANKLVTEAGKKGKTNFVAGALRGLRDKGFDPDTWMMGISETAYYNLLRQAAEKEERGEQLSAEEQQLLDAAAVNMAANAYYAQDLGRGYKAGAVTAESIPFMLQFALNPVSGAGKGIAKTILEHGIKRFGLNTAKRTAAGRAVRGAARMAGDAVAAAGVTATTGLGNVAEDASRRMTGDVQFAENADGNIRYAGRENNVGTGEAIARAFTSTFFENQSEMVGNYFAPVMRGISKFVTKHVPGVKQLSASKVGEIYRGIKNNPTYKEFTDRTQWHGAIGEYAEEVYNNLASVAMGDMTPEELVDLDNNIDTFLGVGLMSAVFGGIGAAGFARDRYTLNRDVKRFESTLSPDEVEHWQEVKRVAQNGDVEGVREFVKYTLRDNSLTPQEKKDEIKYIYDVMQQSAMENVAAEQTEDAVQAETDDIVANSDPQTNTYTECSRLVMNEVGEMVEVPGHIVGYMGGQPLWKPDGAGPEVEAVALKEGEYNPESVRSMPTQEVIDETAQAIREDAAAQAQRESTYSPDIVPPSIGTTFTDGAAQYKIAQQNPDNPNGGWLATRTTVDEKGKPKEEVVEITDEQYYNAMQAQIDAQEQQTASQQATDGVSTGNGRRLDGTGTQQPLTPQQQEVETFRQAGVDEEVIRNTIADRVKKAKVALDKAERQAKAPVKEAKTVKEEMAARKKALDEARAVYEGWNALLSPEPVLQVQQTQEDAGARSFPQGSSLASKGVKDSTIEGQNRTQENQTRENLWELVSYLNSKYGYNFADEVSFVEWITSKKDNIQWLKDRLGHLYKESIQNINDFVSIQNLKNKSQAQSDSEIESTNQTSRPLSADEADALLADMESRAEVAPELELTIENWDAQFGADALVQTPIGEVKMGENQFAKMMRQGRNSKLGMVKPTLENPDAIIEDKGGNVDENAVERTSSYIFVKAFAKPDGGRYYYFTSVTVSKDGREVVISNQEKSQKRISKLLRQNPVAWINDKFSSHPITQIEGSVPLSETNKPTQTDNRPALLGVNSPELSEDKGTNHSAKKQASAVETIPTDEKGRPLYHRASVDATLSNINSKGLTPDEVDAFVQANKDAASKLLKKEEDKAPKMVTDLDKYVADKAVWQSRVSDAQAQVAYWNQVADAIQSQRTQVGDATAEDILSMGEPMDGHELAAQMLATGKLPLLQADFKRETGYKGDEARSLFGLFASEANGGMTIERAGEQLMLADQEAGTNFFDQSDPNAGRNAILDVLSEVRTRGDLTNYIRRNREAMAERERQAEYDAYADWCEREMHMTPEEYEAYQEYVVANNPYEGVAVEELDRIFAEAEEEIQTYLNQQDNGQQGTSENGSSPDSGSSERDEPAGTAGSREAGVSVLPEAQPVLPGQVQGRTEGAASQPGTADDGVRAEEGTVAEGASGGEGIENQINDENNEINVVSSQSNQNDTENEQGEVAGISGESGSLDGENEAATILRRAGDRTAASDGRGSWTKESILGDVVRRSKESQTWIEDIQSIAGKHLLRGGENDVYLSYDGKSVIKVNDFSYLPDNSTNFDSFMNRVDAHNELFPNDSITVLGFTRNSEGKIAVVLSQPYIGNAREATQEEIDNFLEGMDFYTDMSGNWTDGTFDIADTKPNNVLVDADGNLHFIDVLPYDSRKPGKMLVIPPTRNAFVAPEREEGENLLDYAERVVKTKEIDDARKEVEANPTDAQKEAGNYRKGHITLGGYDITIENPKGSTRSGVDANGQSWSVTMNNDYGYIRGTEGVDGDHIDVFLSDDPTTGKVYVIDQVNDDGSFDEHKVMYGFKSALAAKRAYLANYSPGWKGLGTISEVSKDEFKKWVESSHRKTKPFAEYKSVKVDGEQNDTIKTHQPNALPGRLMKAYESGDTALIASVEQEMREFVNSANDMRSVYSTYLRSKDLERAMEKGSPSNKTQHFIAETCKDVLKKAGLPAKAMQSEKARTEIAGSMTDPHALDIMSADTSFNVLRAIIHNPNTSESTLKHFTKVFSNNGLDYEAQQELDGRKKELEQQETEKIKEQSGPVTKIEDVGEKIGGAKKDRFKEFVEKEKQLQEKPDSFMEELRKLPVSKIFNFNLEALRKDGLSNEAATLIDVIRRIVPSKPRTDWKLKRWVSDVFGLYRFCLTLATAEQGTFDQVLERVTHIKKIGGMYRAQMALGGFDSGLDTGQATLEELGDTAGHYDKEGNWISIKGQWYVTNAGRYGGIYPDYETAKDALSKFAGENSKPKEKGTEIKFSIYSYKNSGESFITPKGKPNIVVESGFKSSKEALDYLNEHMDELQAKYRNMKDATSIGFAPNSERQGKDWRGGKDVTAEDFRNTFGFRGVEFGNWANQQERQRALNQAYDAFMDLSEATGVSPHGLSLGGELGMAFGARGGGGAAAHYEPGKVVINLTKTQGAGTLAHEWWHAIDNYFSRRRGQALGYNTERKGYKLPIRGGKVERDSESERKEITNAFSALMKAIDVSSYGQRSNAYASLKSSYWKEPTELGARAFAVWVERKLSEKGIVNNFLANNNTIGWESPELTQKYYPYPLESDFDSLDTAFDNLFGAIEEKVDEETGNTILYRSADGLSQINERFNEELQQQINGTLPKGHIYQLGMPSDILLSTGFPNLPIELSSTRLAEKAAQRNHEFNLADVKNLAEAIRHPLAVFEYGDKRKAQNIIVEIERDGKKFVVGVSINPLVGSKRMEVNSIRGIFPKDNAEWLNWISQGKMLYVDKKRIQDLIGKQRTNLADVDYLDLDSIAKIIENFENPIVSDEKLRLGNGALTDDELSLANDPAAKMTGRQTRTAAQRRAFAERERHRMINAVQKLAEKLHLDNVEIVTEPMTITDRQGKTHRPKGFYNPRTGKIVVVVPNNVNTFDVEQTLLHEAVAHYGLRQLFGEHFDTFLDNVYNNADVEVRRKIVELAKKNGWNPRLATEEYLASLAEETNFEDLDASWWRKIKELFLRMLHKIGFNDFNGVTLSDNELRYILWRSYENLAEPGRYRSILGEAADVVKQHELKVGNYAQVPAETDNAAEGANDLYRETPDGQTSDDGSRDAYNRAVTGNRFKAQEAYQDSMLALKRLQEVVEKYSGSKLKSYENAYMAENQMSSKSTREAEVYGQKFFKPMLQEVATLMKQGAGYPEIIDYMIAKHGLERNEVFAERDATQEAERRFEKSYKELEQLYKLGNITQDDYEKRKNKIDTEKEEYYQKRLAQHLEEDYSGLTALAEKYDEADKGFKANAKDMVNDFEGRFDTRALWERVNAATKETLRKSYESGMMSRDTYDKVSKMFNHYIPLRGWDEQTAEDVFEYLNSETSPVNSVLKSAKGRRSMSDDPLATIGNMAESAILQGNRNLMKQNFLNMAINHPTDVLTVREAWYVKDTDTGEWVLSFPDIEEDDDADTIARKVEEHEERMNMLKEKGEATQVKERLNIDYRISARKAKEHIVNVKRNGKDYLVFVNGNPRAAQAVNGQTNPNVEDGWMTGVSRFNRWMAANFTTRNPAFVMSNLSRDLIFSISAVRVKEGSEYARQFSKNILPSMRAISRGLKGKQPQTEADRYFQEFLDNGGETGFTSLHNVDEYKRIVRKELKKLRNETDYLAAMKWVAGKFSTMNRWAEDVARFNAYMTSRQQGKTITESINDAKEVTVNFNRKGAGFKTGGFFGKTSGVFRGLYLFFNAAVQSLANFIKLGKKNPKAFLTLLGGFTAAGFLVPMLNALLIGDGDDDYYGNLPDWVRRNNLCIYVGDGKFFTLPLPIELRAFYGLGEMAYQAMVGKDEYASENVAYAAINQITELLPLNPLGSNGDIVTTFVPDFFIPFWEAGTNEDFTGKPVFKDTPFNESMPEWTKAYKGTSAVLVDASEKLNEWTGGDKYKKGWIDKVQLKGLNLNNPAQIEHIFEGYFGGMAKTFNQAAKTLAGGVESVLQGEKSDDLQWYSTPVLNRFVNDASDDRSAFSKVNERYYKLYDLYEEVGKELRGYGREAARGDLDYLDKLNKLYQSDDYKKYSIFKRNKRIIDRIRDMEKKLPEEATKEKEELQKKVAAMKRSLLEQIDNLK